MKKRKVISYSFIGRDRIVLSNLIICMIMTFVITFLNSGTMTYLYGNTLIDEKEKNIDDKYKDNNYCYSAINYENKELENKKDNTEKNDSGINIDTPSAILVETTTGKVIYEKDADKALHPASITKIMTLDLIFDAIEAGRIKLEDEVTVSERAASMGGSQVYLEPGEKQTVDTMIKCISVASANDAAVAMAEFLAGNEATFVEMMNEKAKALGMNNTHFMNCCGLDIDGHMSSARDVALMSMDLINNHPEYKNYSMIWMDTIVHSTKKGDKEFTLTNTNKLIKQYEYATGLKTGSTGLAGCCLSASASKDNVNLIAVVMQAPNSKTRFSDAMKLLDYGFSKCFVYQDESESVDEKPLVQKGKQKNVSVEVEDTFSYMFLENYNIEDIRKEIELDKNVVAPVEEGQQLGWVKYYYKDKMIGTIPIISTEKVEKQEYKDVLMDVLKRGINVVNTPLD